jgi:nucleoside-diphosphate-sugar epimerase
MRVAVTGAGGYVGSHIARSLASAGHEVVPLSRDRGFRLGEPLPANVFDETDALIHTAYDFKARGWPEIERVNVRGSIALFDAVVAAGVRRLIFVSSMAAYDGCHSLYGRGKILVEREVLARAGYVVRPGTIYGGEVGGLYRSLTNLVAKLPLVPLPGRGNQVIYLVEIADLTSTIERLLVTDLPAGDRIVTSAEPQGKTFAEILAEIARSQGRKVRFIPVPVPLLMLGLRAGETVLRSKMPVRSDSFVSLLNPNPAPVFTVTANRA